MSAINRVCLSVTDAAAEKITEFMVVRDPAPCGVRILVYADEFGHINHSMAFVDGISSADIVFDTAGITFITDQNSAVFLNGIVLDFVSAGAMQGFTFMNECLTKSCVNCTGACGRVMD
jgi:iron-sulfur cluster assembly protein